MNFWKTMVSKNHGFLSHRTGLRRGTRALLASEVRAREQCTSAAGALEIVLPVAYEATCQVRLFL
jgi:hypothetical protein